MQRICPFLATDDDGRTVIDGFDPGHRCRAIQPSQQVGRRQQVGTCLDASHGACERYLAAIGERGPAAWPPPAPDAAYVQTRLVLDPSQAGGLASGRVLTLPGPRWMAGGVLATVGVAAVASGLAGGLGIAAGNRDGASPTPTAAATATASSAPAIGSLVSAAPATPEATTTAQPAPTATTAPTATPAPPASLAPEPQTYVVQAGDTLNSIALRFGTSVQALQDANGLENSDVIRVGQVLIIP